MNEIIEILKPFFGTGITTLIIACAILYFIKYAKPPMDATADTIKLLQDERDKANEDRDAHKAEIDRLTELYHEVKQQNAMLKMYMRMAFNATDEDFIKAGISP